MLSPAPLLFALIYASPRAEPATFEIQVEGLRNSRGLVHVCATRNRDHFPDCRGDPASVRQTVPATQRQLRLAGLPPGRYAISLFHDQNSNARLDTFLGVPREGFGFSRNPVIRFGAPKFDSVDIELTPGFTRMSIHMQYLL